MLLSRLSVAKYHGYISFPWGAPAENDLSPPAAVCVSTYFSAVASVCARAPKSSAQLAYNWRSSAVCDLFALSIGPVAQSLISDLFPSNMRGEQFGWLQFFLCGGE